MNERKRILDSLDALRNALSVLKGMAADEERRHFYRKLFKQPSHDHVAAFRDALGAYRANQSETADAVNRTATQIAGSQVEFSAGQLDALHDLFFGAYYAPIAPGSGDEQPAFEEFYEALLSTDPELIDLQTLQIKLGDFWVNGTRQREEELLGALRTLGPHVPWDARHIFSLTLLLTLDFNMKQLAPYPVPGSVW